MRPGKSPRLNVLSQQFSRVRAGDREVVGLDRDVAKRLCQQTVAASDKSLRDPFGPGAIRLRRPEKRHADCTIGLWRYCTQLPITQELGHYRVLTGIAHNVGKYYWLAAIPPRNRFPQFFVRGKSTHVFWIQEQPLSERLELHSDGIGMSIPRQVIFVRIAAGPEKIIETKEQGKNHKSDSQTHEALKHAQFELIRGVPTQ